MRGEQKKKKQKKNIKEIVKGMMFKKRTKSTGYYIHKQLTRVDSILQIIL